MGNLIIISFGVLGLSAFLVNYKVKEKYYTLFTYLFFVLVSVFSLQGFENQSEGISLISFLIMFVSFHVILNMIFKKKRIEILSILSLAIFWIYYNSRFEFQDYPLLFDFKNILILPLLGAIFPFVVHFKSKFLEKVLKLENLTDSLHTMSLGILIFLGLFFGNNFGVFLCGISYFVSELHFNKFKEHKTHFSFYLFVISLLLFLVYESKIEIASFLHGSTFLGLFIGVGISLWISKLKLTKELSLLKRLIHFIIPIILISFIVFLELIKEHVGGLSAFVRIIIGLILKDKQQQKTSLLSLISISFAVILMAIPFLQPEQIKEKKNEKIMLLTATSDKKAEEVTPFDLSGKKLSEIADSWKINSDNSKIDFELGPKDTRTKGMFKTIKGVFEIEKEIGNSNLNVTIPMSGFSTFNSFRDDGLKGSDYFDVAKFPNLRFKSKLIKELDDKYLVNGIFEMKGIKEEFELDLKLIEFGTDKKGEFAILVGKSNLNRSKFGMKSDPKMGDLVDFTFELELRK